METEIKIEENNEGSNVYEIGVLFVPTITRETIADVALELRSKIEKLGATIISEDSPKEKRLAYEMRKRIAGKYEKYTSAYFGWIKFEIESEKISEIKERCDADLNILRYLIITTARENTLVSSKIFTPKDKERRKETVKNEPVSVAEIDKTIDEMVKE